MPRVPPGDQQARGERHDQRGDLRDQTVADRELGEDVGRLGQRQAVAGDADDDAAEDVDRDDDQARDRLAAHEFRGAVHGAEERALLLELAPPPLRLLVVDEAGREIRVDRHLLARDRVQGEAGADLGDAGRALGDHQEVHGDQDGEDHQADHEVAAHDELREALDDVAGGVDAGIAVRQDQPGRRDPQRQAQEGRDQQDRRERRELERLLDPERHHQDQHGQGDGQRQSDVDQHRRHRQEQDREDRDDPDREPDIPPNSALRRERLYGRCHALTPLRIACASGSPSLRLDCAGRGGRSPSRLRRLGSWAAARPGRPLRTPRRSGRRPSR